MNQDPENSPATALVVGSQIPSADRVKAALIEANTPQEHISDILWLHAHAKDQKLTDHGAVGALVGYDASVISKVLRGKYGADLTAFCEKVRFFREVLTARKGIGDKPFVAGLSIVRDVKALCDGARISQTIGMLWGPNQSGKTFALKKYAEQHNHGQTIYAEMPVGGSARMTLLEIARACHISERNSYDQLLDRILRHLDSQMLLIVDEVHQALIGRTVKTVTMELLRRIHDRCGCGLVLCGTDVLPDMVQDPRFAKLLGQTDNRGVLRRSVPAAPTKKDVRLLCEAYGLERPTGDAAAIVTAIATKNGIGKLCKYFQMSRRLASKGNAPLSWDHVLNTHATLTAWAAGKRSEREEAEE
jgi:hypothetical protein